MSDASSPSKKRHYLLREDYDQLMELPGNTKLDPEQAKRSSRALYYPKNTEGAFRELRFRGLDVDGIKLWQLATEGIVHPEGALPGMTWTGDDNLEWSKEDIDQAAKWLYEHHHWNSWTHFCWVCNLRFGQCIKAHRLAAARYGWGWSGGFDVIGKNFYVERAENPDEYAFIRFLPEDFDFEALGNLK